MLTAEDAKNLLSIINRTSFQGSETEVVTILKNKLMKIVSPESGKLKAIEGKKDDSS